MANEHKDQVDVDVGRCQGHVWGNNGKRDERHKDRVEVDAGRC